MGTTEDRRAERAAARWALALLLLAAGCAARSAPPAAAEPDLAPNELLQSVLWMQTAAEYRAAALQSFRTARARLDEALADPDWTAALEQGPDAARLPPAIIVDVDETMLDNSAYEARLVLAGEEYDRESWHAWCREERAAPVPGAVAFARYAAERGVRVFYVTNRRHVVEEPTRRNLRAAGFPVDADEDTVLTRGERPEWAGGDKSARRAFVAERYRVLLLVGDNLGDFLPVEGASVDERFALVDENAERWGRSWILLPNPAYGSWEQALLGETPPRSAAERLARKREALRTR